MLLRENIQQQTLITSANLSYHGQQGNIEFGTLIESKQIAKQIDDVFTKLIFQKCLLRFDLHANRRW